MNEIEQTAFEYGRNVALRERFAHGPVQVFYEYNKACLSLWSKLKDQGAYADEDGSQFKQEYRDFYYAGMDSISG